MNHSSDLAIKSLGTRGKSPCLEIQARRPSEIKAISPSVDRLIRLVEESRSVSGEEASVALALRREGSGQDLTQARFLIIGR